jgi:hypothetical protein
MREPLTLTAAEEHELGAVNEPVPDDDGVVDDPDQGMIEF